MAGIDVVQWLEQWVELNLHSQGHVERKAEMHDQAKACAEEAKAAGIPIVELKDAAEGDLEAFLVRRQNAAHDRRDGSNGGLTGTGQKSEVGDVIKLYEERLDVGKREVSHGAVKVRSHVVETPVEEQVSLHDETVRVDRRPVDRVVTGADALFQDRTIELEEFAEEAVISKEVRVVEEISLRKEAHDRTETIRDTVRHTEVEIEDGRTGTGVAGARGVREGSDEGRIVEHMEVYASDGTKVGTVDHMDGPDRFKLARSTSPDGQHHFVPMSWVDHVDRHVHLNRTLAEIKTAR